MDIIWLHTQYHFNLSSNNSHYCKFFGGNNCAFLPTSISNSLSSCDCSRENQVCQVCSSAAASGHAPVGSQPQQARQATEISSRTQRWCAERWHVSPRVTERAASERKATSSESPSSIAIRNCFLTTVLNICAIFHVALTNTAVIRCVCSCLSKKCLYHKLVFWNCDC